MPILLRSEYTEKTLQSISENCQGQHELVLCMDGEDQETYDKLKKFYNSYLGYAKVICPHRSVGVSFLRNKGIEQASGDVVLVINDDILLNKNFEQNLDEAFEENRFVCPMYTEGQNAWAGKPKRKWDNINGSARAIRKSKRSEIGPIPFDEIKIRYNDDYIFRRLVDLKQDIYRSEDCLIHHFRSKTIGIVDVTDQIKNDKEGRKELCQKNGRFDERNFTQ